MLISFQIIIRIMRMYKLLLYVQNFRIIYVKKKKRRFQNSILLHILTTYFI